MRKRILSALAAFCMLLALLSAVSVPALAGAELNNVMAGARGIDGGQDSNIYFGTYPQSSDGEGGYNTDPIKWRVLDKYNNCYSEVSVPDAEAFAEDNYYIFNSGTGEFSEADAYDAGTTYYVRRDSLFLLADRVLDVKPYDAAQVYAPWESCTARSWLNGYDEANQNGANIANPYENSFSDTAFSGKEWAAVAAAALPESVRDKVYFILEGEAGEPSGFESDGDRQARKTEYVASILTDASDFAAWWLRSSAKGTPPGTSVDYANPSGYVTNCNANYGACAIRPAIRIDESSVLLSTAANFDNSEELAKTVSYDGDDWKLTLLDGNTGFDAEAAQTTAALGGSMTVDVTSLGDGEGYTQISAMLIRSGDVICYGKIGTASTGQATFDIPYGLHTGSYTLRLFAEDAGGPYAASFASNTVDISLTLTPPVFPFGARVKLVDDSVWIVLEDEGGDATQFTLVRDGFLSGTYTRSGADTALSDYQTSAYMTFNDDGALTRLPAQDEVRALREINSFVDQDTGYWLANSETSGWYQWANGNSGFGGANPDYYTGSENAVRPVLTVLKSALLIFEPFITQQPQDADFLTLAGDDAVFSVAAAGVNLAYQWQVSDGEDWTNIADAEEATLTVDSDDENYALGKTFRCRLDSDWGEPVYSGEATLMALDWQQYGGTYAQAGTDYTVSGDGNTVTIHTAVGLGWLAAQVNEGSDYYGKTAALDRDIDLSGRTFVPIGADVGGLFCGHFDGGMHTVSGMMARGCYYNGLFGCTECAVIENLIITDGSVSVAADAIYYGDFYVGALCGYGVETTIRNVGVGPVAVSGRDDEGVYWLGGIVGYLQGEHPETCVYNSYSRAVLTGSLSGCTDSNAGGIAGCVQDDTVANCYFAGSIVDVSSYGGGIAGLAIDSEFSDCYWQTGENILCAYYTYDESYETVEGNDGCTALTAEQMKSSDTVTTLNAWAAAGNTAAGSSVYELWGVKTGINDGYPIFKAVIPAPTSSSGGSSSSARTITVTETSSGLFSGAQGAVRAEANMTNAFSTSVEVKVTDTDESASCFGLGAGNTVYPFDISLYIKGTDTKTEPKDGYAVTISLPVPEELLDIKEQLSVAHMFDDGTVTVLPSQLKQSDGVWYLVFEATEFSPYALVVNSTGAYDGLAGLPYYVASGGNEVFIGFAANGKYIAPSGVTVLFKENTKSFTDTGSHWAKNYIEFVTEREIFLGMGSDAFSPDSGMTRAMFATAIGRLYERSYGEIETLSTHAFADCDYGAYYGKYVDWAAEKGIIGGYGNGKFGPGDQVTREQMAAILYRFADFLGVLPGDMDTGLTYSDADIISSWAESAALYCQSVGIISGRAGGTFEPQETATRAEVAAIIERFIESVVK